MCLKSLKGKGMEPKPWQGLMAGSRAEHPRPEPLDATTYNCALEARPSGLGFGVGAEAGGISKVQKVTPCFPFFFLGGKVPLRTPTKKEAAFFVSWPMGIWDLQSADSGQVRAKQNWQSSQPNSPMQIR